jgi:putative transposase
VRRTVPPSTDIQSQIDALLAAGVPATDAEGAPSQLARLGAQLIIQRAVEDEFDAFLGRERYERRADALPGKRNGYRPRHLQTAEGELTLEIPQLREAAATFTSKLFPRESKRLIQTEPLKALIVGGFVRGLSTRDVESLCSEAGLGQVSPSSVSRSCQELRERYHAFRERDLRRSSSSRSSSTRSTCPCGRRATRRASSAPGGSTQVASGFSSTSASGCASPRRTGSRSGAVWSSAGCAAR